LLIANGIIHLISLQIPITPQTDWEASVLEELQTYVLPAFGKTF